MIKKILLIGMASGMLLSLVGTTAASVEDINAVKIETYTFAGYPDSTLVVTNNFPTEVKFEETAFGAMTVGPNRHDAWFSSDGGTNRRAFLNSEPFDFSLDVTLEAGTDVPRKEAGLRIDSTIGGDGLFIITTNQPGGAPPGEIVAFGGALPFYSFNATNGLFYNSGDTINMRMKYTPGGGSSADPGTVEFIVDILGDVPGPVSSGPIDFTNLEGGVIDGSNVGVYAQATPSNPVTDFSRATFGSFVIDDMNATALTGDMDCDGDVDFDDIDDLVLGLNNPAAYEAMFGVPPSLKGDTDGDDDLDFDDISGFVAILSGAGLESSSASVPEPSTVALAAAAATGLVWHTRRRRRTVPGARWKRTSADLPDVT